MFAKIIPSMEPHSISNIVKYIEQNIDNILTCNDSLFDIVKFSGGYATGAYKLTFNGIELVLKETILLKKQLSWQLDQIRKKTELLKEDNTRPPEIYGMVTKENANYIILEYILPKRKTGHDDLMKTALEIPDVIRRKLDINRARFAIFR